MSASPAPDAATVTSSARQPTPSSNALYAGGSRTNARLERLRRNTAARQQAMQVARPKCPNCGSFDIEDMDGTKACASCGALLDESNIVSEVTFGETAGGAAVVHGGFVGEGQRNAKTMGPAFRRAGGTDSREISENYGRDEIRRQAAMLALPDHFVDAAFQLYKLASTVNFIQGRRMSSVAAVCLYVACRRDRGTSTTLLIDFAELLHVNVYKLGQIYTDMKRDLWLGDMPQAHAGPFIEPEKLIEKYCRRLEFGSAIYKVADDAAKIMRRMGRDWIVSGRLPSGLCGACIILAARMNNFSRSVREVVYVVKVCDLTVTKRIEEFARTESSKLSVRDFREKAHRLHDKAMPPVFYYEEDKKKKEDKRRQRRERMLSEARANSSDVVRGDDAAIPDSENSRRDSDGFRVPARPVPLDPALNGQGEVDTDTHAAESSRSTTRQRRKTTDSPLDESIEADGNDVAGQSPVKSDKKKKKKSKRKEEEEAEPLLLREEELLAETALENEMEEILNDPKSIQNMEEARYAAYIQRAEETAEEARAEEAKKRLETIKRRKEAQLLADSASQPITQPSSVPVSAPEPEPEPEETDIAQDAATNDPLDNGSVHSSEFDSDPEVQHCALTPAEQLIKETIWVSANEDWLRQRQARQLKQHIDEAHGLKKTKRKNQSGRGDAGSQNEDEPEENERNDGATRSGDGDGDETSRGPSDAANDQSVTGPGRKKRKHSRMGDGSVLLGGEPVRDASDATRRMLEKRVGSKSRHINYEKLIEIYGPTEGPSTSANANASSDAHARAEMAASPASSRDAGGRSGRASSLGIMVGGPEWEGRSHRRRGPDNTATPTGAPVAASTGPATQSSRPTQSKRQRKGQAAPVTAVAADRNGEEVLVVPTSAQELGGHASGGRAGETGGVITTAPEEGDEEYADGDYEEEFGRDEEEDEFGGFFRDDDEDDGGRYFD